MAFFVIPQNNIDNARCAIGYGGEIEIGEELNNTVNIKGKEYIIIFKSSSINPIKVDECFEKPIFASFEIKNIEILGCFRNKNNIIFKLTKIKDQNSIIKNTVDKDIYFEMSFKKPKNEKVYCVILENNNKSEGYSIRCAIKYGGEIEVIMLFLMDDLFHQLLLMNAINYILLIILQFLKNLKRIITLR